MANATYECLEFRLLILPDVTELYILCGPTSDGTLGVQGWHKRTMPASAVAMDELRKDLISCAYLTGDNWSMGAPPDQQLAPGLGGEVNALLELLNTPELLAGGAGPLATARVVNLLRHLAQHTKHAPLVPGEVTARG